MWTYICLIEIAVYLIKGKITTNCRQQQNSKECKDLSTVAMFLRIAMIPIFASSYNPIITIGGIGYAIWQISTWSGLADKFLKIEHLEIKAEDVLPKNMLPVERDNNEIRDIIVQVRR